MSRRHALRLAALGMAPWALRSLAAGLPPAFLVGLARRAGAGVDDADDQVAGSTAPQFLVISTSGDGDPVGSNAPGTYPAGGSTSLADIVHPADASCAATPLMQAGTVRPAAQFWSRLPQAALDRLLFFHHASYTDVHTDYPQVLGGMGKIPSGEMLPSLLALELAPMLGTIQAQPINLANPQLTCQGAAVPLLPPSSLKNVFGGPSSPLESLAALRDHTLDQLNAALRAAGNPAQRAYLDLFAQSRNEAKSLGTTLLDSFSALHDDGVDAQLAAAVALIRMNISPVVSVRINFGGDNHSDPNLSFEVSQSAAGVQSLATFWQTLASYGLTEKVSFAMVNVFGRTFKALGTAGRNHHHGHSAGLILGPKVRGGVIGGLQPMYGEYAATGIDAASGGAVPGGGDVPFEALLGAFMQTVAVAAGIAPVRAGQLVVAGKAVTAALV